MKSASANTTMNYMVIVRITLLLVLLVVAFQFLRYTTRRAFYVPDQSPPMIPPLPGIQLTEEHIPIHQETLHTWILEPVQGAVLGTVVFCHGNAGNLSSHVGFCDFLPMHGYRVVLFDYRGYGASSSRTPDRDSTMEDSHRALDWAFDQYPDQPIFLMGHSLGGTIALAVAGVRADELSGVVAIAPFSSYRGVAHAVLQENPILSIFAMPLSWAVEKGHDPIDVVAQIAPTPVLLIHGERDMIVPSSMSRELYEAALEPKQIVWLSNAQHNDDWQLLGSEFVQSVLLFLQSNQ